MPKIVILVILIALATTLLSAQSTEFTYQGKLTDGGSVANGTYQMQFSLFDAATGGTQIGSTVTDNSVTATNGIFTVTLDFGGGAFNGSARWIEIAVKKAADPTFTLLTPRQPVTSSPYAVKSLNSAAADVATNSTQLGGVAANQFVQTTDPRMSDARDPLPGSTNYIQNGTSPQPLSNFNISGNGTAGGTLTAGTQFNIGPDRVFSVAGLNNVFGGIGAGAVNTGIRNAFFGADAGVSNTTGADNAFFGTDAGYRNTTGGSNAFFGFETGESNTTGIGNAFFGTQAGLSNTTGGSNAFFGINAGQSNTTSFNNAFFGAGAGFANTTGFQNAFFGSEAGSSSTTGGGNAFFGFHAGFNNTTGNRNTIIGNVADVGAANLLNASAIGYNAFVTQSNSLVLGSINGVNGATANTNVGIGTTAPTQRLHVVGNGLFTGDLTVNGTLNANLPSGSANYIQNATSQQASSNFNISGTGTANIFNAGAQYNIGGNRVLSVDGTGSTFAGFDAGAVNTGVNNAFFGGGAGKFNTTGASNAFFGYTAGTSNTTGNANAFFGVNAGLNNTTGDTNAFFGINAGFNNTTADNNAFFGGGAGFANTTGANNSFFGELAGSANTLGSNNSFFGHSAGEANTTGFSNAFFGTVTGSLNTTGSQNSFFGVDAGADSSTGNSATAVGYQTTVGGVLNNVTAIGAFASVTRSNSLVLGSINGVNGAPADTNVGIGTTAPQQRLHVVGNGLFTGTVRANGGMYIPNPNTLVITSPNGACWGITVSNTGVVSAFPVTPCP